MAKRKVEEKNIKAVVVPVCGKPRVVSIPVDDPRKTLQYMEREVGKDFNIFRGLAKDLDLIYNNDVDRYFSTPPCRAAYTTDEHIGRTLDLYEWDEDWLLVEKHGELIGVIHGNFLVIARTLDDDMEFAARSMTDAEIAYTEELFADESTGRLEELKRNLGIKG
ncbi:hypothetical protein [Eggerthella sp. YY7918]|uniref:hypothetical protein n=1 Tax=Eggerthella sp. (strain YY7918) TaxID=502558 RepID=UPI0002170F79|nr:hypothetical protein [Eggerthella sp. YY7918]BAK43302.1 hypothetical protein EGYY_00190 [Eggerthella sp. YY7918]